MNARHQPRLPVVRDARVLKLSAIAVAAAMAPAHATTPTTLADQPVFSIQSVPGNVALALSVEFPTAISVAHQGPFTAGVKYIGYFDPAKCYRYVQGTEADDANLSHFTPVGSTTAAYKCTDSGLTDTWSGSFLNWLTMQAIDPFKQSLTGGYRRVDTATTTILERTWSTDNSLNGSDTNFPPIPTSDSNVLKSRPSPSNTDIADHTPLSLNSLKVSVRTRGNRVRFTQSADLGGTPTHYSQSLSINAGTLYEIYVRVKVCESGSGYSRESNCVQYSEGWKPEGLLQQYAEKMRFSAFGYLNDPTDDKRDGGVLRARQKYVGPRIMRPSSTAIDNPNKEWNSTTGVMVTNPDSSDASATASAFGVTVNNSGVINYVNKFGQEQKTFKRRDPVSELYYGVLRYLKNQGSVGDWTAGISTDPNKNRLVDGFPVITTWDDPLQYSCQRNFVLGIGDTNTNWDRNLPGATGSNEPSTKPTEVSDDNTVNTVEATDKVGSLHGINNLGTKSISNGSYLIAGLAYDAHTKDIRPDDASKPQTKGMQTVKTYWLDVLEFATYVKDNQYYLAAKYGGFNVPRNYQPYSQSTDIAQSLWSTSGQTVGNGSSEQPRPDTYYTVAQADQMATGLQQAFASIASDMKAYTTSFSTSTPRVSSDGSNSYSTTYDASTWSGDMVASTATFDSSGEPTVTDVWRFRTKLGTQLAGTGWDTARRMVTWNPTSKAGIAFRSDSLLSTQLSALDTSYRSGNDSGDYLKYLRGDTTHEVASTAASSAKAYRTRDGLVGDVVNSKARPIGPPSAPYSAAANAGYSTFKSNWSTRPTVVYFGTNTGVLHAVNGAMTGDDAGKEIFAYVPNMLFQGPSSTPGTDGLASLGNPTFEHHAMVDGSVVVADIDFNKTHGASGSPDWRSVLIGAMGKGGKGYYAIDVTDPAGMTSESTVAGKVLWEFTHTDLGFTYGEPVVVKTAKYGWVVIFGSGYNNSDGKGYFFIVNPRTGALLEKVATNTDGAVDAGLAHVQAFVLDRSDGTADSVYGGDLLGNLWRVDLRGSSAYPAATQLASLRDSSNNPLPVTSRPLIVVQPGTNTRWITLGTGRLLASGDTSSTQSQAFFAIKDGTGLAPGSSTSLPSSVSYPITKTNLLQLTDLTKKAAIDTSSQVGWWYDLGTGASNLGWRVLMEPTAFNGIVSFTSMLPSGEACSPSGTSRVYAIDLGTGQSKLTSGSSTVSYLTTVSGVVSDLRFYSVSTKPRLIACNEKGECKNQTGNWTSELGMRRLNWRELQTAD